jgi:hypothetical protein
VVIRTKFWVLNEDIYPWYLPYYNQAQSNDLTLWGISTFNNSVDRISIGLWIKESNNSIITQNINTNKRDGYQQKYDLTTLKQVLNWDRNICGTVDELNSYYCSSINTDSIKSRLQAMWETHYQEASYLMNQEYMIPPIMSSMNKSVHYLPYNDGILWFQVKWNGDTSYVLSYITINNNSI